MTMQNPYQAPQADVADTFVPDSGIEQVASAQKLIIYAILGYFAAVALQGVLGLFAALLLVLVVCAALVYRKYRHLFPSEVKDSVRLVDGLLGGDDT